MGIYDRDYYRGDESFAGGRRYSATAVLVAINVALYVCDMLFFSGTHRLMYALALEPETFRHPLEWWRFISYAFSHDPRNFGHIVINMLTLWFMGHQIEPTFRSEREYVRYYLFAALAGGIVWSLRNWYLGAGPASPGLVGASGSVVAVTILFALTFPHRRIMFIFGEAPAWVLAVILVGMDLAGATFGAAGSEKARVAHDVHLVGAAFAVCYFYLRFDLSYLLPDWLLGDRKAWKRTFRLAPRPRIHQPDELADESQEVTGDSLEDEADRILAKLHQHGEGSLTKRERLSLEEYSRRVREKKRP